MPQARYARQIVLAEIGDAGQKRLASARVLIVGLGGLGAPTALYLAAAGVGSLGLVDADRVAISNLQRQILYDSSDQGRSKVTKASARLQALNPDVHVAVYPLHLTAAQAEAIAQHYDIIVDGSDNFATKYLLNDLAVKLRKPLVYGSVLRWEGQVATFWAPYGPCYRCLYPEPPPFEVPNCAEAGVIGALAGIIGSIQALEVIKLILLGKPTQEKKSLTSLLGRLLILRGASMDMQHLKLDKNLQCPVCSLEPEDIYLGSGLGQENGDSAAQQLIPEIKAVELFRDERWRDFVPLDIREESEWLRGHLPEAQHWPLSRLREGVLPVLLSGSKPTLVYCQSGSRSQHALQILSAAGWQNLAHLSDGFAAWEGPVLGL